VLLVSAIVASAQGVSAQIPETNQTTAGDSSVVYSGVYNSTFRENIFSPCDVPGIGSGWAVRFNNPRHAAFLQYQYPSAGAQALTHFIRVSGRVSPPGRYGIGFQSREIVVDSVHEILETPQPCASYEEVPQPWEPIASSGSRMIASAVSDDRTLVAVLDLEAMISIWSAQRGVLLRQFPAPDTGRLGAVREMAMKFTRDGTLLAVGGADGVVRVWSTRDGKAVWTLPATDTLPGTSGSGRKVVAPSAGLAFNDSGTLLANMIGNKVAIWSMTSGKRLGTHDGGPWGGRFLFLGDSSFIASGDSGLMKIYPRLGAPPIWRVKAPVQSFESIERSSDGRWLIVRSQSDIAHLWSLADGVPSRAITIPGWAGVRAVAFSPDGRTLAMSGGAYGLYLWETSTGDPLRSFQKYPGPVTKAWFTADGKSIVTHSMWDSVLRVVRLDIPPPVIGRNIGLSPVQAVWGSYIRPANRISTRQSITGFVRDSAGRAVVGAKILVHDGNQPRAIPQGQSVTNAAGRFLVQGITARHVIVRAEMQGLGMEIKYVHLPNEHIPVDFLMRRAPR
jgi:hypothetical protein